MTTTKHIPRARSSGVQVIAVLLIGCGSADDTAFGAARVMPGDAAASARSSGGKAGSGGVAGTAGAMATGGSNTAADAGTLKCADPVCASRIPLGFECFGDSGATCCPGTKPVPGYGGFSCLCIQTTDPCLSDDDCPCNTECVTFARRIYFRTDQLGKCVPTK